MALSSEELSAIRQKLAEIARQQADLYDALTGEFERQLEEIAAQTLAVLMQHLHLSLTIGTKGEVLRDARNLLVLTRLDDELQKLVKRFGYRKAIAAFVGHFPKTFNLLDDTFRVLSYALEIPKLRTGKLFLPGDLKILHAQQTVSLDVLGDVPADVGRSVKRKALQSVGGQTIADMQQMLHKAFATGTSQAVTLGATAMATFYRVASDQIYQRIEADGKELKYIYFNPDDRLTRPFCKRLIDATHSGKSWTRDAINRMNNGQTGQGTVFQMAGGFNCRGNWAVSLQDVA